MKKAKAGIFGALVMIAAVAVGSPATAEDSWLEGWEFDAGLYTWLPEIRSTAQVGDRRALGHPAARRPDARV